MQWVGPIAGAVGVGTLMGPERIKGAQRGPEGGPSGQKGPRDGLCGGQWVVQRGPQIWSLRGL